MGFVPMALKAAGLDLPTDRAFDGRDPTPTLTGETPSPHEYLYWQWGPKSAAAKPELAAHLEAEFTRWQKDAKTGR